MVTTGPMACEEVSELTSQQRAALVVWLCTDAAAHNASASGGDASDCPAARAATSPKAGRD